MTLEMKIRNLFEEHNAEWNALNAEYEWRWGNVSVNSAGEASAEEVLAVNEWYEEEKARLEKKFIKAVVEAA